MAPRSGPARKGPASSASTALHVPLGPKRQKLGPKHRKRRSKAPNTPFSGKTRAETPGQYILAPWRRRARGRAPRGRGLSHPPRR